MSNPPRYHYKVINPQLNNLQQSLEIDTNYELIRIIPYTPYETVLVFIEHTTEDSNV